MNILAAISVVLKFLEALIVANQDKDGHFSRVSELLTQLKSLGEEPLSRLMQRINVVGLVLSRVSIPSYEEFQGFVDTQVLSWLPKPSRTPTRLKGNWQNERLKVQKKAWAVIGVELPQDLCDEFVAILNKCGAELVATLEAYGFMFVITPDITWTVNTWPAKWVKLNNWFWQILGSGRLLKEDDTVIQHCKLQRQVLLIYTRKKPVYADGRQCWDKDVFMEALIGWLQDQKKLPIDSTCGRGSRFRLSRNDYTKVVAPALLEALQQLGCPAQAVRLEYCPEHSAFCQLFDAPRKDSGKTTTWLWFQERLDSSGHSLHSGVSGSGGLAFVSFNNSDYRWNNVSASLVAVMV